MPLSTTLKKKVIKEFQTVAGDTGSPEVQIALLTTRIDRLTEHLKMHIHDKTRTVVNDCQKKKAD